MLTTSDISPRTLSVSQCVSRQLSGSHCGSHCEPAHHGTLEGGLSHTGTLGSDRQGGQVGASHRTREKPRDFIVLVSFINKFYNEGSHEVIVNKISYSGHNTIYMISYYIKDL